MSKGCRITPLKGLGRDAQFFSFDMLPLVLGSVYMMEFVLHWIALNEERKEWRKTAFIEQESLSVKEWVSETREGLSLGLTAQAQGDFLLASVKLASPPESWVRNTSVTYRSWPQSCSFTWESQAIFFVAIRGLNLSQTTYMLCPVTEIL